MLQTLGLGQVAPASLPTPHSMSSGVSAHPGVNISTFRLTRLPAANATISFQAHQHKNSSLSINSNDNNIPYIPSNSSISGNYSSPLHEVFSLPPLPPDVTSSPLTTLSHHGSGGPVEHSSDSSIIVKISLLLVVTAFVLVASYKFVVHLFLGYSDRKDDAFTDGYSDDEDEDSTGMKKHHGPILDIG